MFEQAEILLPLGGIPPGETFLLIQPRRGDHNWQYSFGGLVAKMVDAANNVAKESHFAGVEYPIPSKCLE